MHPFLILGAAALFQQGTTGTAATAGATQGTYQGATSPASGDTVGYWQQRVAYTITAKLNEAQDQLEAQGRLVYHNNSPDTLREMFFHQYLNAFRPGSKWSAVDEHEHRVRFQKLGVRDIGYERLRSAPTFDGTPVIVDYPGAPDSTVMHFRLPRALPPGDSAVITFQWDARPSTVTRRQGRKGRTYDFAQWFPKVAVYDRGGWEPNPLVPAGELYGEFGDYDVTLLVRADQVIASTGVPVDGDPGWARVSKNGKPVTMSEAYGDPGPTVMQASNDPGYRTVRFRARNVHHFAWSASPDYQYEGGSYVRQVTRGHYQTWDTVAVHVLFKPGDDTTWGGGRAVERTITALKWLESLWGPYAYPQITNVHRLDPGGTEFPMMIMDGSASQGLILHEFGHVFTYGILANNEWRSGWMDEGLTDYQTDWAQRLSPQDRNRIDVPPLLPTGYRVNATTIPGRDSAYLDDVELELLGRTQPIGTPAYDFSEFGIYNEMIYNRAKLMYGQLRELMGDSVFHVFAADYYHRWALKHVDERAMQASAERAYGKPLDWFFAQWVHGTGLMDYELTTYSVTKTASGYETIAQVGRVGDLRHPMPVGVKTASGWTIVRADPMADHQSVHIVTRDEPTAVSLDPYHATFDWDRRNDVLPNSLSIWPNPKFIFNWPYLQQEDRTHTLVKLAPTAWYSDPQGIAGGVRARASYLGMVDQWDVGVAMNSRNPFIRPTLADTLNGGFVGGGPSALARVNLWVRAENLYLPGMRAPAMGLGGDVNWMDGLFKADLYKKFDLSPFIMTRGPQIGAKVYATVAMPTDSLLLPEQWTRVTVGEVGGSASYRTPLSADSDYVVIRGSLGLGGTLSGDAASGEVMHGYGRGELSIAGAGPLLWDGSTVRVRAYVAGAPNAPMQRSIFASSQDPFETFTNDLFRPRGALFKQANINYLPLGGAGLRGFSIGLPLKAVAAVNGEVEQQIAAGEGEWGNATLALEAFGDIARAEGTKYAPLSNKLLSDVGAGVAVRGRVFDRGVNVRLDFPFFVNQSGLAGGHWIGGNGSVGARWTFTVGNLF